MHILDTIVAHKKKEVATRLSSRSIEALKQAAHFSMQPQSMRQAIISDVHGGIISEFKRKSPSKQAINLTAKVSEVVKGYQSAGVAGLSVLTDEHFFGGTESDFLSARSSCSLPMLRKDFILDPYQIYEAKAMGADIILLIARILSKAEMQDFTLLAHDLGLEVLVEVHDQEELDKCPISSIDIIGVNNRNLDTFEVNYEKSIDLANQLPQDLCRISESGIKDTATMVELRKAGFDGFLIGEAFMRSEHPGDACDTFLKSYRSKTSNS